MEKKIIDSEELKLQCDKIVDKTKQCLEEDKKEVKRLFGSIKESIQKLDDQIKNK